ncbi:muscleblind-like protein 3 [Oscarella lobularis]|uniref:muscleblind-like protein 3 n=1 Tax=Oscarella lobularis TaxID=121494 RepID=UPI003313C32C
MTAVAMFNPTLPMQQQTYSDDSQTPSPTALQSPSSSPLAWSAGGHVGHMMMMGHMQQQQHQHQHQHHYGVPRRPDKSDKLEVCREYLRGDCKRGEDECRFAHPPADVAIDPSDGMVTVCMDFIKSRCARDSCRFLHPPAHLQARVKANQLSSPVVPTTYADAMLSPPLYGGQPFIYPVYSPPNPYMHAPMFVYPQSPPLTAGADPVEYQIPPRSPKADSRMQPVCRDFMTGKCERPNCRYIHLSDSSVEVIDGKVTICRDAVKGRCSRIHCKYYHIPNPSNF